MKMKTIVCWISDGMFDHMKLPEGVDLVFVDFDQLAHEIDHYAKECRIITEEKGRAFRLSLIINADNEYAWTFLDIESLEFMKKSIEIMLTQRMVKGEDGVYYSI